MQGYFLNRTLSTKKKCYILLHFPNALSGFFSCSVLFRLKESGLMEPMVQMWILSTDPTISGYSLQGTTLVMSTCTDIPASVIRYIYGFVVARVISVSTLINFVTCTNAVLCVLSSVTMTELRSLEVAMNSSHEMQTLLFGFTVRSEFPGPGCSTGD